MVLKDIRPTREEREQFEKARQQALIDLRLLTKVRKDIRAEAYLRSMPGKLRTVMNVLFALGLFTVVALILEAIKNSFAATSILAIVFLTLAGLQLWFYTLKRGHQYLLLGVCICGVLGVMWLLK